MAYEKRKKVTFTTPKGIFVYPKLNEPDLGTKQYPKDPPGEYSLKLRLPKDDPTTQRLLDKLQPMHDQAVEKAAQEAKNLKIDARKKLEAKNGKSMLQVNALYTTVYDKETEAETGDIEFKFTMKAGGTIKNGPKTGKVWSAKPVIVDARGQTMANPPSIWGGTVGIVSFEVEEGGYFISGTGAAGISMRLAGVQIVSLVSGGQRSAASLGFGAVEGGYEHDDTVKEDDASDDTGLPQETGSDVHQNTDF